MTTQTKSNWETIASGQATKAGFDFYFTGTVGMLLARFGFPTKVSAFASVTADGKETGRWVLRWVTGTYETTVKDAPNHHAQAQAVNGTEGQSITD